MARPRNASASASALPAALAVATVWAASLLPIAGVAAQEGQEGEDAASGADAGERAAGPAHMEEPEVDMPDRPTSGDLSLFSGRTISKGDMAVAAGVAWPGIWAGVWLAPSSRLSIGIQGHVYYGSPIMAFSSGAGGGLTVPVRLHLWGKGNLDFSFTAEPGVVLGEGQIVGQTGVYQNSFGYGIYGLFGGVLGAQLSDIFTVSLGAAGEVGYVHTPSANISPVAAIGGILGTLSVEAAMSRDTLIFLNMRGGVGFAGDLFSSQAILNAWLGLAYLL